MGYTAAMFVASIFLGPIIFLIGAVLFVGCRSLNLVPSGGKGVLGYLLIVCSGFGLLYLYVTVDQLVLRPARFQEQYLGARVAGPLSLVAFEAGGFQDPYAIWRYSLPQEQVQALHPHCRRWVTLSDADRRCTLFSARNERWDAVVELRGNEFYIEDGLH